MFKRIIEFSLKNSSLVLAFAVVLTLYAVYNVRQIPVDVFPELNAPTVTIMTECPGYAADEVEQYVSFPIESAVNGIPGVRRVRSSSAMSLSIVWVEFEFGADIYRARQLVAERLDQARENLPEQVHAEIAPIAGILGEMMLLSVTPVDDSVTPLELRGWAEFELRNKILAVGGIAEAVVIGGELPEYQIDVDQDRLTLYDLTIQDVVEAAKKAHATASAGYLPNVEGKEMPLRQDARVTDVSDIRNTVIKYHEGVPVTIGDVVIGGGELGATPSRGTGSDSGNPAVIVTITKSPGTNTLELTKSIDKALDALYERDENGELLETVIIPLSNGETGRVRLNRNVMRSSDFIGLAVDNVVTVLRDAAILVAILLVLFLMNVRTTMITLTALPLSLAVAILALWLMGLNINVMTLGGLAVAIGELVDDAIIDVENVFRRLRENRALPDLLRKPHVQVVYEGSNEIRGSIVFATIIIAIVFVPLLFLEGLEGRFFRPLGLAYIVSIMASLFVAVTVTPAMCKLLLKKAKAGPERESILVRSLKKVYVPVLRGTLKMRVVVVILAVALTGASVWFASLYGTRFLPEFNEGTFTIFLNAPAGTSLYESDRLAKGVDQRLSEIDGVSHVVRRTGRAERDQHAHGVSVSEIEVSVEPGHTKEEVRREIDRVLKQIPGITTTVGQPIEHRLSHVLSGTPAAIAISVYGDDMDKLRQIAKEIEGELKSLPGARDVAANREMMIETIPIHYRRGDLAQHGFTPADAAEQVEAAFNGVNVADVNQGLRRYAMVVRLDPAQRETMEQVKNLVLVSPQGRRVRLREVADVGVEMASDLITRENGQRKSVVSLNVAEGYNMGHLVEEVQTRVNPIVQKHGYAVHYGGQFEAQQSASRTLYIMGAGVVLLILLLLYLALKSMRCALLVMLNLPLALIGGIVAIFISESANPFANLLALMQGGKFVAPVISIASMVGFITLFGIAVRNGILLVSHYQHLQRDEGLSTRDAIIKGSSERLIPILMTAVSAMLGLIPLAMAAGEPGSELLAPLAVVVLGGLVTSTFLNLVVVPAGYLLIGPRTPPANQEPNPGNQGAAQ
ncbi:MAG: efflux RND transporter permease subunit [Planctomycetes bacterium]|nr:efflux RND transporter permease subunit [Planctomycetota bacterium]MCA8937887.1 efflux RND transporter permease subunit [Planctomycetota bacterium]